MTPKRTPKPLDEFTAEQHRAKFREHQDLAQRCRAAAAEARDQAAKVADLEQQLSLFKAVDAAKITVPEWLVPKGPSKAHHAIPTLNLADVHWGEKVEPGEIEGINKYDVRIAGQRTQRAFEGTVVVCRDYLKGLTYDGITLDLAGDMLSGDIHEELRETNVETVAESVVGMLEALEGGVKLLVKEFKQVHVVGVPGNHPRDSKKPRAKQRAAHNFDTMLYRLLQRDLADVKGVTVQVSTGADAAYRVYDHRYILTHGDQFKGGSGISGALAPLLLGTHRKTRRAAAAGQPYDTLVMGHFHQSIFYPSKGLIVGGCVKGYDEFSFVSNYEPEPPQCALWLTTPERGITMHAPVFVMDRAAEGW